MPDATAPLIVITVSDPSRAADPELAATKNALYADAVERNGGRPVLVSPVTAAAERDRLFGEMAGLLFSGGADIDPALYGKGAAALDATDGLDRDRDDLELAAWREAERRGLPVLGICRGHQAINVFAGGQLIQDVPEHAGTPYGHGPAKTHDLDVDPDSRLGRAVAAAAPDGVAAGDESDPYLELQVNTFHHQAVGEDTLAPGLRATAWASSGEFGRLVEGFESLDERWIVGIQCHPERTDSTPAELEGLFAEFVRVCASVKV
jgi:putative glutamine amidotransferase